MSRILIDGRFVGVGDSMTRYILEILPRLLQIDRENEYTLLLRPQGVETAKKFFASSQQQNSQMLAPNLQLETLDVPHYSISEQTKLLNYLNEKKFDLVHFIQFNHPVRYRGKYVVTIHDLTLMKHAYGIGVIKKLGFRAIMKSAVQNSAKIITVSNYSKKEIADYYNINPEKIAVTYLAVDEKYNSNIKNQISSQKGNLPLRGDIKKFKEKYQVNGDYILYAGMWKKHKNLIRMLKAFEKVSAQLSVLSSQKKSDNGQQISNNLQLVLVGKVDKEEFEVMKTIDEINSRVMKNESGIIKDHNFDQVKPIVTTGFIDNDELPVAYAGALAYCIPSLSEGFGLPPLEAMACGTPVIASTATAIPEILADAPLYFDPLKISEISKAMEQVILNSNLRELMIKKGLKQVKQYSWEDTAKKTLSIYKEVLRSEL